MQEAPAPSARRPEDSAESGERFTNVDSVLPGYFKVPGFGYCAKSRRGCITEPIDGTRADVRMVKDGLAGSTGVALVGDTAFLLVERAKGASWYTVRKPAGRLRTAAMLTNQ